MKFNQGTKLKAKVDFYFKVSAHGRMIQIRAGQSFWITNNTISQQNTGLVSVSRYGQGQIGLSGWCFKPEQIDQYFQVVTQ